MFPSLIHLLVLADINTSLINLAGILKSFVGGAVVLALTLAGYYWMSSEQHPGRRSVAQAYLWAAAFGAMIIILASSVELLFLGAIQ